MLSSNHTFHMFALPGAKISNIINNLETDSKRRGDDVKTSCPTCFGMEYLWSVCRGLAGGFFSTDAFCKI